MFKNLIPNKKDFATNLVALAIVAATANGVVTNRVTSLFDVLSGFGSAFVAYATGKGQDLKAGKGDGD